MKYMGKGTALALAACLAAANAAETEQREPVNRGTPYGPVGNAADQFRYIWGVGFGFSYPKGVLPYFDEMCRAGLNTHILGNAGFFQNLEADAPVKDIEKRQQQWKAYLDHCAANGIGLIQQCPFAWDQWLRKTYPRINRDGSEDQRNLDAANPEALARSLRGAETLGRSCAHPAVIGIQNATEIRDACHPSFTPAMRAAYKAYSGHDIPDEVLNATGDKTGRTPPKWTTLKDFPADRVVDDDYPVLDFYVWSWKHGDGWCDWLTAVADRAAKATGRDVFTMYDPSLRTPPMWGSGGDVTFFNHWTYVYPEPYNIGYNISEQISRARKNRQGVLAMIQAISYRSRLAPIGEHPANEPEWTKKFPNAAYPTTPPDMLREAMWTVFSRRVDGIGFHGWNALWEAYTEVPHEYFNPTNRGYHCANPRTREVIREVFETAGRPLGPLFRAIPERAPRVAVVESYASMILGSRITWDCSGRSFTYGTVAVAANLMPAALNEDEIRDFGIPDSVETLVMADCDVLTRRCYEKIAAFKARGGRIVADGSLCPALKADAILPDVCADFPPTTDDHDEGKASPNVGAEKRERSVRAAAVALREAVGPKAAPYADSDRPDILVSARTYRTSDYVFAINDRRVYGDYVGAWKRVKEQGVPNSGTVVVNRGAGAVYDLVSHTAVPFTVENGKTSIKVSYQTTDGRVFLVCERPLGKLSVSVRGTRVTVTSPDKDVMIPIRLDGVGSEPYYAVVADGRWEHDFARECGCVTVTDLATGRAFSNLETVSGALPVEWQPLDEGDPLAALLPPEVRFRVVVGRIPGKDPVPGFRSGALRASDSPFVLFAGDRRLPLSRYPNEGDLLVPETAVDTGSVNGRLTKMPEKVTFRSDVAPERLERWRHEPALWAWGCWKFGWADSSLRIEAVDPAARTMTVWGKDIPYGIVKGNDTGGRYYMRNALSEIDMPGEWALDSASRRIFLFPPVEGLGSVVLACRKSLLVLEGACDRVIEDRLFENCRGDAIVLRNCTNVVVRHSVIRNAGGWGVRIEGGRDCRVEGCDLYNLGEGGVQLNGGDRDTLTPARHVVDNCHIRDYGQWIMNYRPGVNLLGVGSRATHNLIHDSVDQGIVFSGNDHYIASNIVHDVCRDNYDCGAIYTHTKRDWWARGHVLEGNVVHGVGGRRPLESVMGIYIDGWSSGVTVRGNIVSRSSYGIFQNGGNDNIYEENVVVGCQFPLRRNNLGLVEGRYPHGLIKEGRGSWLFQGLDAHRELFSSPLWKARYPNMLRVYDFENPFYAHNSLFTVATNNVWAWSGSAVFEDHELMKEYSDIHDNTGLDDIGFVDYEGFDWELAADSKARALLGHGLVFAHRGLYASPARISEPVRFGPRPMGARRAHTFSPPLMRVMLEFRGDLPEGVGEYAVACSNCSTVLCWWPKGNVLRSQDVGMRREGDWTDYAFSFRPTVDADVVLRLSGWRGERTAYDAVAAEGCELENGDFEAEGGWKKVSVTQPDSSEGLVGDPHGIVGAWYGVNPASGRRMCLVNAFMNVEQTLHVRRDVPVTIRFKARACQSPLYD